MAEAAVGPSGWERALVAAEKVKERLRRATRALDAAGVPYAVAEWVGRVDEDAVHNTRDVDLLVRRADLAAARAALEAAGFVYHHLLDIDLFPIHRRVARQTERRHPSSVRWRKSAAGGRAPLAEP